MSRSINIVGSKVGINSGGSAGSGSPSKPAPAKVPTAPYDAEQAKVKDPVVADDSKSGAKSVAK